MMTMTLSPGRLPSSSTCAPQQYIHQLAHQIRNNEPALAAVVSQSAAASRPPSASLPPNSSWNPLGALSTGFGLLPRTPSAQSLAPATLTLDPHHLYYLLLKFDEIALDPGLLDVNLREAESCQTGIRFYDPTTWMIGFDPSYKPKSSDRSDTASLFSNLSNLSLGSTWWGGANLINLPKSFSNSSDSPQWSIEDQVKYLYSTFTKLPSLRLTPSSNPSTSLFGSPSATEPMQLLEGFTDLPNENAVPLSCFKSIWSLYLEDLDPRTFIGWAKLSQSLRRLEVRRSGLEDFERLLIDAVVEDITRESKRQASQKELVAERSKGAPGEPRSTVGESPPNSPLKPSPAQQDVDSALPPAFPALAWSFLQHLCLADNALTFVPSSPLAALVSLTSLDLSSNLLIVVPVGLATLTRLKYLNLADNMIDSVLGIYQSLGCVSSINLSRNRLSSLCGLERLYALERLDIRQNQIHDVSELSRLATLPTLTSLWASRNPFCVMHKDWTTQVFTYFASENRDIDRMSDSVELKVENQRPTYSERKMIQKRFGRSETPETPETHLRTDEVMRRRIVRSPDGKHIRVPTSASSVNLEDVDNLGASVLASAGESSSTSSTPPSHLGPKKVVPKKQKARCKKQPRIVELDSFSRPDSFQSGASTGTEHHSVPSSRNRLAAGVVNAERATRTEPAPRRPTRSASTPVAKKAGSRLRVSLDTMAASGSMSAGDTDATTPREGVSNSPPASPGSSQELERETSAESGDQLAQVDEEDEERREGTDREGGQAFRRKIEALRDEVGEGWLRVLGESEFGGGGAGGAR